MRIRSNQLVQITHAQREESFRRLAMELRRTSPHATSHLDDDSLLETIRQASEKARAYGIESDAATTLFSKIAVFAGSSFDQDPTIQRFLRAPELDPDYKIALLAELVTKKLKEMS